MAKKKPSQPAQDFVQGSSTSHSGPSNPSTTPANHPLLGLDAEYSMGSMLTGGQWAAQVDELFDGLWEEVCPQVRQSWDDTEALRSRYRTLSALRRDLRDTLDRLHFRLENCPVVLRPVRDLNEDNLRMLIVVWFAAVIDQVTDVNFGAEVFPVPFHPFLPNRPAFIEVFSMNPEIVSMYGLGPEMDEWNMLKSENGDEIPVLRLDPQVEGGSLATAIGVDTDDETNPSAEPNPQFPNLAIPRPRNAPPPPEIDLRLNPFNVAYVRAIDIPFGMEYPPRFDILAEARYYMLESGHFISLRFTRRLFRLAIEFMNSYSTECNAERAHWWWETVLSTRPTRRCELCVRRNLYCGPRKEKGKVTLISCGQWRLILRTETKGLFRLALTKNAQHLKEGFQTAADTLQSNVNEYAEYRIRTEVRSHGLHNVEYWTQQYLNKKGERYRRLLGDADNRADRGEVDSSAPYEGAGDEREAESSRKGKSKSREKLKGIRLEKVLSKTRGGKKARSKVPPPSVASTSRAARSQQIVLSSEDEGETSRPKSSSKRSTNLSGKATPATSRKAVSTSESATQAGSNPMMPRPRPPCITIQPRSARPRIPISRSPEEENPMDVALTRISDSLRRDTSVRMGEGEIQATKRRVRRRPQRMDGVEIPPPPPDLVSAMNAASPREERIRDPTPLFLPSESPGPMEEGNEGVPREPANELQYPDNHAADEPGPSSRTSATPVTLPPILVGRISPPFGQGPGMPPPSSSHRDIMVQTHSSAYRDSSIQTAPMVLPPQVIAMRERQFDLERELLAARAEIDHLRGEYQLSQDSLRDAREQMNAIRQAPSQEFLGADGVRIRPGDIPRVISIANRAQNAAAGPILGVLSAMAGTQRSDFMRWEQEVSDGQRNSISFARNVLEHSRSFQDFLLQAETAYDSVMSAQDRREGLNFLRAHGSRVPHAIRRMWPYTGSQWNASMVARSEGIISENPPSDKVLGKRKERDVDEDRDGDSSRDPRRR
ncbi:hypothetical protein V5O48_016112 [Marasmius crinis-equi]|uniref:Uncharacterized protein n=1 Tax=Marasmius crinis-equi TaxID=585013 RepID=A0ABR3ESK9_9AGAR